MTSSFTFPLAKLAGLALGILFALCMTHFTFDAALADMAAPRRRPSRP